MVRLPSRCSTAPAQRRIVLPPAVKGGPHANAIGRSRGGPAIKLHALMHGVGRLVARTTALDQHGDAPIAAALVATLPASATLVPDRPCGSDALRRLLLARGTTPVIPNGPRRKNLHPFDRSAYKRRNLVDRAFCLIKDLRRVATRYDKLAETYVAAISLAALVAWWL